METPTGPPRPRQVTLAAWLIMLGSAFVVLTMFERIAGLHTLETQRSVEAFLSEPPGDGLGLGLQGIQDILHTLAMVAAGCAAAAAILGFQILQRSRLARVLLSVLAVPLFLAGLVSGGFLSSVVAAAVVMLWFQPSRDWFNGVTRESPPTALTSPAPPATTTGAVPPISAPPQQGGPVDPVQHRPLPRQGGHQGPPPTTLGRHADGPGQTEAVKLRTVLGTDHDVRGVAVGDRTLQIDQHMVPCPGLRCQRRHLIGR